MNYELLYKLAIEENDKLNKSPVGMLFNIKKDGQVLDLSVLLFTYYAKYARR